MEILIVDDNRDICEMMEVILESEGFDVGSCSEPCKAESIVREKRPKLIITDLLMGSMNGRELCTQLRQIETPKPLKIMMMSAHPDGAAASKKAGADVFMPKPFEIDELTEKISELLK